MSGLHIKIRLVTLRNNASGVLYIGEMDGSAAPAEIPVNEVRH